MRPEKFLPVDPSAKTQIGRVGIRNNRRRRGHERAIDVQRLRRPIDVFKHHVLPLIRCVLIARTPTELSLAVPFRPITQLTLVWLSSITSVYCNWDDAGSNQKLTEKFCGEPNHVPRLI